MWPERARAQSERTEEVSWGVRIGVPICTADTLGCEKSEHSKVKTATGHWLTAQWGKEPGQGPRGVRLTPGSKRKGRF